MANFEGYDYYTTVSVDEICDFVYDPDGPINQRLDDMGVTDADTTDGICVGVGLASAYVSSPSGWLAGVVGVAGGALCESGQFGCAIEEFAAELSGFGTVEFEIHLSDNVEINAFGEPIGQPILIAPKCSSGLDADDVLNAIESAGGFLLDEGEDILNDIQDEASECADDLWGCGEDIVDQGSNILGF